MARRISFGSALLLLCASAHAAGTGEARDAGPGLRWHDPSAWRSDGMWTVTRRDDAIEFLKDSKPAHNSMCWMDLEEPLRKGDTIEITYRMERPYKHIDLFLGRKCAQPAYGEPMHGFREVLSLGGIPDTDWQTRRIQVTSDGTMDTVGFLSWGWAVDRNTWMQVANLQVTRADGEPQWCPWPVSPLRNPNKIPARCPLQDFFPFGVYISIGDCNRAAAREGKGLWEWLDEVLGDLKRRGMNFTSVVNFGEAHLDRLVELHRKHGLRMNPQAGQFDIKHNPRDLVMKKLRRAAARYRDTGVIAGWAVGEEFRPAQVPELGLAHEIVHAVDPRNTLVTIHNRTEAFEIIGRTADVRIAFRDVYPFFNNPRAGPTTFEASMNYFEDEIDKCHRWLPRGASLWVMPQAQGEHGYIRTPTPAEIKVQAWAAIAHGAQGLAYFVYHSASTPDGGKLRFNGLRGLDGSPTDRLEALTELAADLVPLGPVITRWRRTYVPAETDRRSLRAYLLVGPHGKGYALVYNRSVEEPSSGRVRLPFPAGAQIVDLVTPAEVPAEEAGGRSIFPVRLPPGDGRIFSLGVRVPPDENHLPR